MQATFTITNLSPCLSTQYVYVIYITLTRVARMGERRGACRVLVGKPVGKGPIGRSRRRWGVILK